jgi:hypothetical protein
VSGGKLHALFDTSASRDGNTRGVVATQAQYITPGSSMTEEPNQDRSLTRFYVSLVQQAVGSRHIQLHSWIIIMDWLPSQRNWAE